LTVRTTRALDTLVSALKLAAASFCLYSVARHFKNSNEKITLFLFISVKPARSNNEGIVACLASCYLLSDFTASGACEKLKIAQHPCIQLSIDGF
jgi:hypothetical protein